MTKVKEVKSMTAHESTCRAIIDEFIKTIVDAKTGLSEDDFMNFWDNCVERVVRLYPGKPELEDTVESVFTHLVADLNPINLKNGQRTKLTEEDKKKAIEKAVERIAFEIGAWKADTNV